ERIMMSSLSALVRWCSTLAPVVFVRDSRFGMPAVQSVHLVGITVLLAAIVVLDLRLAGLGMMNESLPWVERQLKPWILGAVTLVILSGGLIFLGTPSKYAHSNPFRIKMAVLGVAIAFHFGVLRRFVTADGGSDAGRVQRLVAALSVTL